MLQHGARDPLILCGSRAIVARQWIRRQSEEVLAVEEGALYPALHRLERRGQVASAWGRTETGRRARFYRLTARVRQALQDETARWKSFSAAVHSLLDTSEA